MRQPHYKHYTVTEKKSKEMKSNIQIPVGKKEIAEINSLLKSYDMNRMQSAAIILKYDEYHNYDFIDKWKYFEKQ